MMHETSFVTTKLTVSYKSAIIRLPQFEIRGNTYGNLYQQFTKQFLAEFIGAWRVFYAYTRYNIN